MRRRIVILPLLLLALAVLAAASSGCGEEEHAEAKEGEPLEIGELSYNIQITRELNRFSPEDAAYLEGAPPIRPDQQFLGVFMQVTNQGEEAAIVPEPLHVVDTRGTVYRQVPLENEWALRPGTEIEPGETFPGPETVARNGSIEGSLALFVVDESANENRPLVLEIPGRDEHGEIVLDL
jgi:hypothetical protein